MSAHAWLHMGVWLGPGHWAFLVLLPGEGNFVPHQAPSTSGLGAWLGATLVPHQAP